MTVLISGESGSGKESFSKIIHALSPRKHGQFIAINCGAIPEGTIDSELFGHEKGSFTGANEARKGYFEVTNGGTIFLDEIGEMPLGHPSPPAARARKWRVHSGGRQQSAENRRARGGRHQRESAGARAGRHASAKTCITASTRCPSTVPPLRERGEDIYLLFRKFATDFAERYRVKPITPHARCGAAELQRFRFPGNIRQLKNIAEQMSVLETERELDAAPPAPIPARRTRAAACPCCLAPPRSDGAGNTYSERDLLYKVLFDMRRDMTDLKKMVLDLASRAAASTKPRSCCARTATCSTT